MEEKRKSYFLLKLLIFIVLVLVLCFLYSKYLGINGLIVKEYRINSDILTSNYDGIKIVHFSDLLYGSTIDNDDVTSLVDRINLLKPDLVLFTGDLVSKKNISEEEIEFLISSFSKINSNLGKYAIYGDNDYSNENYEDVMTKSGFNILSNSSDTILYKTNEPLYIVGIPSSIKENIDLEESFKFYDETDRRYTIVLTHDGNSISSIVKSGYEVDLILSGHSLNGSIVIPYYGGLFYDKYNSTYKKDFYKNGITNIYISSGLGTNKYPYRFNNKPSFNLYRLKAQSN